MSVIDCTILRGGTSKGVFVLERFLPSDSFERDRLLLALMGSPDARQINGLGGGDPLTSKVAIVSPSSRPNIDVEYESVEVGIAERLVNHGIMCGNLIAGVGHFGLTEGLIKPQFPITTVRIYCRSNRKIIVAQVPVTRESIRNNVFGTTDDMPPVRLTFEQPGGAVTGKLLAGGEPLCAITLSDGRSINFSVVDAGTLYAFMRADAFGLAGDEQPTALDSNHGFRTTVELARVAITDFLNAQQRPSSPMLNPRRLKMAIVSAPRPERTDADIVARVINPANVHKAYAVSGAICLAAAAVIKGTLVNQIVAPEVSPFTVRIAHPSGTFPITTHYSTTDGNIEITGTSLERTARVLMRGTAYLPDHAISADVATNNVPVPVHSRPNLDQLSNVVCGAGS
jgi:methylitaconate Delta-isomerase